MTNWISGSMSGGAGAVYVSTDEGVVRIDDADVRADERERLELPERGE